MSNNNNMEKVINIIEDNYNKYRDEVIKNYTPEALFNIAYDIAVRTEIYNFIIDNKLSEWQYGALLNAAIRNNEQLLPALCAYFFKGEYISIDSYSAIDEWIRWFCSNEVETYMRGKL